MAHRDGCLKHRKADLTDGHTLVSPPQSAEKNRKRRVQSSAFTLMLCALKPRDPGRTTMAWTTPTLVEICIGLEINGYLPAEF
jgi:coenzyme PQQ precursor peptide PqqA